MAHLRTLILTGLLGGLTFFTADAQTPAPQKEPTKEEIEADQKAFIQAVEKLGWTREGVAKLGSYAEVGIPKGYRFTDGNGTRQLMKMTDNFPTEKELGMLTTEGNGPWIIFEWNDSGHVKDDDKDQLDPDATLKAYQEGTEASNEKRRELGMGELHLIGWAVPPRYNDVTKNLEWATRLRSERGESINYNTRLLGREGVMEVTLVCSPAQMQALLPEYQAIISSFHYIPGQTYAEYREGDKLAKYGVTGLLAAGGAVMASKMGLFAKLGVFFAKLGKGIFVVIVAVGLGLKKLFTKFFCKPA
jgi:uncharacterized membrane-anchored protein